MPRAFLALVALATHATAAALPHWRCLLLAARDDALPPQLRRFRGGAKTDALADTQAQLSQAQERLSKWWSSRKPLSLSSIRSETDSDRKKAASLMRKRGLDNCLKAVELLRAAYQRSPDDAELKLELADALNAVMRIKTNANTMIVEGTQDSPSFKKIWRNLGSEALPLAKDAYAAMPGSVRALAVYADSFMFSCSSKGIVQQALTGAGKEYKRICSQLLKHPNWDSAVGCALMGAFYNVAPWPVGNKQTAAKYFADGAKIAPSRRNMYYVGVNAYQRGDYAAAKAAFEAATKASCGSPTETDFGEFMLSEARRALRLSEQALAASA